MLLDKHIFPALLALCTTLCIISCSAKGKPRPATRQVHAESIKTERAETRTEKEDTQKVYREIPYPTPNYDREKVNKVEGVILHHTAEATIQRSLGVLTSRKKNVGTHCVIDTDGTRYIMCKPEVVTYHAGKSALNGKIGCNNFTIGIEFQGNTLEKPLTEDQIKSAIQYLLPIMRKYHIPLENVVTHEMVREAYLRMFPNAKGGGKVDITQKEYKRFMKQLRMAYHTENK